jgi:hypothetical protein
MRQIVTTNPTYWKGLNDRKKNNNARKDKILDFLRS